MIGILFPKGKALRQFGGAGGDRGRGRQSWTAAAQGLFCGTIVMAMLFFPLLTPLSAREDNARLVLQKTAGLGSSRIHVVKRGESIATILRSRAGDERISLAEIRRLNPDIRNMNRIYPGQRIVFPVPGKSEAVDQASDSREESPSPEFDYRIREGDSISRILITELNLKPTEVLRAYRIIRKLNPEIKDLNRLEAGQTLHLPPRSAPLPPSLKPAPLTAESAEAKAAITAPPAADDRLGMIQTVIYRMRGAITATGSYFIPLQESAQITIDCSMIPVVELDDGTTVLLDFGNRLSESLKGLIRQSWSHYAFLAAGELHDGLAALQGIIRHSRGYRMIQADKPLSLLTKPEILLFPDWIIAGKETAAGPIYRQVLFLLDRGESPLPSEVKEFLEKNGIVVTEIAGNHALPRLDPTSAPQPALVDFQGLKGIALAERLLTSLGETPVRNAEVTVFDEARNGFNLSITADLLLRRGDKRVVLQAKKLPDQFLQIIREAGTEVIPIGETDHGRPLIERVLQGLGIPVSYGFFSFRIPKEGVRPRLTTSFSALRTSAAGRPLYLMDFDLPPAGLPLLQNHSEGRIGRY